MIREVRALKGYGFYEEEVMPSAARQPHSTAEEYLALERKADGKAASTVKQWYRFPHEAEYSTGGLT
jgi:hypothetical protein